MDGMHAALLGVIEGLTEFVPVSSTGHLILMSHWLGHGAGPQKAAADAFDIVIQAGAWLACVGYYLPLLKRRLTDVRSGDDKERQRARNLLIGLAIATVPVVVAGLVLRKPIKAHLFGPEPVAVALAIGGALMIATDVILRKRMAGRTLDALTGRIAVTVGVAQCFALIPGTSRSMATMIGGLAAGLDVRAAADFAFLLAIPVLGAATGYEALKEWRVLWDGVGPAALAIGLCTSFAVGWVAIAGFLRLIGRVGLWPFGAYRIALAAIVWRVLA